MAVPPASRARGRPYQGRIAFPSLEPSMISLDVQIENWDMDWPELQCREVGSCQCAESKRQSCLRRATCSTRQLRPPSVSRAGGSCVCWPKSGRRWRRTRARVSYDFTRPLHQLVETSLALVKVYSQQSPDDPVAYAILRMFCNDGMLDAKSTLSAFFAVFRFMQRLLPALRECVPLVGLRG